MPSEAATTLERSLAWAILTVVLTLSSVLGLLTTYALAAIVVLAVVAFLGQRRRPWIGGADSAVFTGGFLLIVVLFAITARSPVEVLVAVNFVAFLAYAPIAAVLDAAHGPGNALRVAWLALAGVALALVICVVQVYGLGEDRAHGLFSDTIRLANTTVITSFIALMGLRSMRSWWRLVFLLAPLMAIGVVLLTGTRIAMVAFPIVALVALVLSVPSRWRLPTIVALAVLFTGLGYMLSLEGNARFLSIFDSLRQLLSGERIADRATRIRIELYKGAWDAFQLSPIVGHGWSHLMSSVSEFLRPGVRDYATRLVHLHNDVLTMGVAGGILGIALYLVLIVVPPVLVIASPVDGQKAQRILGVGTLVTCYVVMGLTDTMIAFEMNTMLYVVLVAALLHFCRDGEREATS